MKRIPHKKHGACPASLPDQKRNLIHPITDRWQQLSGFMSKLTNRLELQACVIRWSAAKETGPGQALCLVPEPVYQKTYPRFT